MHMLGKYNVDDTLYTKEQNHNILMKTEQYHFEAVILTKLTMYEPLKAGLFTQMPGLKHGLESHFYFLEDSNNPDKKQPIYQQYFDKLLKEHNLKEPSYAEVLEELPYTDKKGAERKINIAILQENDGIRTARIEFESDEQSGNFTLPDWLIHK